MLSPHISKVAQGSRQSMTDAAWPQETVALMSNKSRLSGSNLTSSVIQGFGQPLWALVSHLPNGSNNRSYLTGW